MNKRKEEAGGGGGGRSRQFQQVPHSKGFEMAGPRYDAEDAHHGHFDNQYNMN